MSGMSCLMKGSPPVIFVKAISGSFLISSNVISSSGLVGSRKQSHILQWALQRYVTMTVPYKVLLPIYLFDSFPCLTVSGGRGTLERAGSGKRFLLKGPLKTPVLSEVFSSLASAAFLMERERAPKQKLFPLPARSKVPRPLNSDMPVLLFYHNIPQLYQILRSEERV